MNTTTEPNKKKVIALLEEKHARFITFAFVDIQGQLRGKTVRASKLASAIDGGVPFAPYNHTMDFGDESVWPRGYLSSDIAIEDNPCDVVLEPRTLPFEDPDSNLLFFVEFAKGTTGHPWDPRVVYHKAEERLTNLGLIPSQAVEYEFRVFDETIKSVREKGFQDLDLIMPSSNYGGIMHQGVHADLFKELRDMADTLEVPVESLHWETGASIAEVAIQHQRGIRAADDAVLFKTHAKASAQRHDYLITFMARPFDDAYGQSGHVHLSLVDDNGNPAFHDANGQHGMSQTQRHFVGGLQQLLPELLLMLAPNVNSFKRYAPGIFTPIAANWGIDNRTCAIRVIPGKPGAQRIEVRVPGSDANPYLALAAIQAAGARGMEEKIEPAEPQKGSTYRHQREVPDALRFPRTFQDAIDRFAGSEFAREVWSDEFVGLYAGTRQAQQDQFSGFVTDKERMRFLEFA